MDIYSDTLHWSDISLNRYLVTELNPITVFDVITLFRKVPIGHSQRVRLANRGRLRLRTPGPVPFGTCICFNVEFILSRTCHVYGPLEFRTSLGTSILLNPILSECLFHTMGIENVWYKGKKWNSDSTEKLFDEKVSDLLVLDVGFFDSEMQKYWRFYNKI